MTVCKYNIYEIKKVLSSIRDTCFYDRFCKQLFFIHHIYTIFIVIKTLFISLGRFPIYTISICCQKENMVVVVPFAADDSIIAVFSIIEIAFNSGNFLIFAQFQHLLLIELCASSCVNFII